MSNARQIVVNCFWDVFRQTLLPSKAGNYPLSHTHTDKQACIAFDRVMYGEPGSFCVFTAWLSYADWSGAFFLQSDPDPGTSGDLHILNPNRNSFLTTNYSTDYRYHSIPFSPVVNRGLFFASHLVHYVDLNRSNTDRISIAYHIDASPYEISDFKIDF